MPGVMLATLCLNEMEHLPALVEQHRGWPDLGRWVFVEAADRAYADANPGMVSPAGLSVDGTGEFLAKLAASDGRVVYVRHGFTADPDPAKGKCVARQRYLDVADEVRPEFVISLDADEFYTSGHQQLILDRMRSRPDRVCFVFHRREVWRPPSVANEPLFSREVVGGFWGIPCCHWWRFVPGMHHRDCHNTPTAPDGKPMNENPLFLTGPDDPQMVHLGFAASEASRRAKHNYYVGRGEGTTDFRGWYVDSRRAWFSWRPGDELPNDAQVVPYRGPVPEVFRGG